jgi:hypothetical protein
MSMNSCYFYHVYALVVENLQVILNKPVEEWPICSVLLCWHSQSFPLEKAQQYVRMRRPFVVNDVFSQDLLLDRRKVYQTLQEHNVPTPTHIVVSRTLEQGAAGEDPDGFEETVDYVAMVRSVFGALFPSFCSIAATLPFSIACFWLLKRRHGGRSATNM